MDFRLSRYQVEKQQAIVIHFIRRREQGANFRLSCLLFGYIPDHVLFLLGHPFNYPKIVFFDRSILTWSTLYCCITLLRQHHPVANGEEAAALTVRSNSLGVLILRYTYISIRR